jgi:hypothetical protein
LAMVVSSTCMKVPSANASDVIASAPPCMGAVADACAALELIGRPQLPSSSRGDCSPPPLQSARSDG